MCEELSTDQIKEEINGMEHRKYQPRAKSKSSDVFRKPWKNSLSLLFGLISMFIAVTSM
jgi:hypothetical protein